MLAMAFHKKNSTSRIGMLMSYVLIVIMCHIGELVNLLIGSDSVLKSQPVSAMLMTHSLGSVPVGVVAVSLATTAVVLHGRGLAGDTHGEPLPQVLHPACVWTVLHHAVWRQSLHLKLHAEPAGMGVNGWVWEGKGGEGGVGGWHRGCVWVHLSHPVQTSPVPKDLKMGAVQVFFLFFSPPARDVRLLFKRIWWRGLKQSLALWISDASPEQQRGLRKHSVYPDSVTILETLQLCLCSPAD